MSFTAYYLNLGPNERSELLHYFNVFGIWACTNDKDLQNRLKYMSQQMLVKGDKITAKWNYFVGLERFGDYEPGVISDVLEDIEIWLATRRDHGDVSKKLPEACLGIMSTMYRPIDFDPKLFYLRPSSWATSGSSTISGFKGYDKTKWATALKLGPEGVSQILNTYNPMVSKVLIKREKGKARGIVAADVRTNIKMSYIYQYLQSWENGRYATPIFGFQAKDWVNMSNVVDGFLYQEPFDYEKFDHYLSLEDQRSVLCTMQKILPKDDPILTLQFEHLRKQLDEAIKCRGDRIPGGSLILFDEPNDLTTFVYDFEGRRYYGFNQVDGLVSGIKFTSIYGTFISFCNVAMFGKGIQGQIWGLGDDLKLTFNTKENARAFIDSVTNAGYGVNPRKFYISRERNEFLRNNIEPKSVRGYPARALSAILSRNPVSPPDPKGAFRLRQQLTSWMTFYQRGIPRRNYKYMIDDMVRGNNLPRQDVVTWLQTASVLGGAGLSSGQGLELREPIYKDSDPPVLAFGLGANVISHDGLKSAAASVLRPKFAPDLVSSAEFRSTGYVRPYSGQLFGQPVSTEPIPDKDKIDPYLFPYLVETAIEKKEYRLPLRYIKNTEDGELIYRRSPRNLYIDWLRGRVIRGAPWVDDYHVSVAGDAMKASAPYVWGLIVHRSFGRDLLKSLLLMLEKYVRTHLATLYPVVVTL